MLSDGAILKHIARQSKRQAGYKQLVRELDPCAFVIVTNATEVLGEGFKGH